ncbi:hypothetical protein Tco_0953673 [Tanacetum coccineum]|uniref:Uncharacterized protein n=1 Tax=Tanacetum coccineum TaxID=301880 RepID=A0ABQ5E2H5_9ASTR
MRAVAPSYLHLRISIKDITIRENTTSTYTITYSHHTLFFPLLIVRAGVYKVTLSPRKEVVVYCSRSEIEVDDRSLMSGQLNMLLRDRRAHARIARLMETEATLSREAWVQVDGMLVYRPLLRESTTGLLYEALADRDRELRTA